MSMRICSYIYIPILYQFIKFLVKSLCIPIFHQLPSEIAFYFVELKLKMLRNQPQTSKFISSRKQISCRPNSEGSGKAKANRRYSRKYRRTFQRNENYIKWDEIAGSRKSEQRRTQFIIRAYQMENWNKQLE